MGGVEGAPLASEFMHGSNIGSTCESSCIMISYQDRDLNKEIAENYLLLFCQWAGSRWAPDFENRVRSCVLAEYLFRTLKDLVEEYGEELVFSKHPDYCILDTTCKAI